MLRWLLLVLTLATTAAAQDWTFIGGLVAQTLDVRAEDGPPILFSDHPDPGVATYSLIFHYYGNREGGNAMMLNVGLFRRDSEGWRFIGPVDIYGEDPRDVTFHPGQIDITTTMPGPNDPRCCPTVPTRWAIDKTTLAVGRGN